MKSFLEGKKSIALGALRPPSSVGGSAPKTGGDALAASVPASPTIETIKEGDKIVRLVITCVCGQRVEVECLYQAGT